MLSKTKRIKRLKVPVKSIYEYIQIFNGIFKLTPMELEILSEFIRIKLISKNKGIEIDIFSMEVKKQIADRLGKANPNTLNTYMKNFRDKGAIITKDNGYDIHWMLIPLSKCDEIRFIIN